MMQAILVKDIDREPQEFNFVSERQRYERKSGNSTFFLYLGSPNDPVQVIQETATSTKKMSNPGHYVVFPGGKKYMF
jgi:hypothetical protein